jgi:SAM-dependent methyltransferase
MSESYIIHGGSEGAARLSVLRQAMDETTGQLLDHLAIPRGARVLDVGCGAGEVTYDLARRVGPGGTAVGLDIDAQAIAIARAQAPANAEFHVGDLATAAKLAPFDLIYGRFLLSHLADPAGALAIFREALKPGGRLAVEDVDFAAHICWPPRPAFDRYLAWYQAAALARGADPAIGQKLPGLLRAAGFEAIDVRVTQPAALEGPAKAMAALTLAALADVLVQMGVAREAVAADVADLEQARDDPMVLLSLPRVIQCWGRRD